MLINLRNALMAGKRLPYDAEVEYLESTGTQWIDTGVAGQSGIDLDYGFSCTSVGNDLRYPIPVDAGLDEADGKLVLTPTIDPILARVGIGFDEVRFARADFDEFFNDLAQYAK